MLAAAGVAEHRDVTAEEVVQSNFYAIVVEHHRLADVEYAVTGRTLGYAGFPVRVDPRLVEASGFQDPVEFEIERIKNIGVGGGEDRNAKVKLPAVGWQHPDRDHIKELGRRRLVQIARAAGGSAIAFAQSDDLHFATRGYRGKAMFVAIDKATAVRMYDKTKLAVARLIAEDEEKLKTAHEAEGAAIADRLTWMRSLDTAVVVSQSQNEIGDMKAKGLDILPHRARMQQEDLEAKFKDADDPLRLVFVCAMWITGFDVPSISTVFLDKPMRNHTLMQTIARANRRAAGKSSGVFHIVDLRWFFAKPRESATGDGVKLTH